MENISEEKSFVIYTDVLAEWAVKKILAEQVERDRLLSLANEEQAILDAKKKSITDQYEHSTAFLMDALRKYYESVPHRETTTKGTYRLLSGTLVWKKDKPVMEPDMDSLVNRLQGTDYIKTESTVRWGEYKKRLVIDGDVVIDTETGEVLDDVKVTVKPGEFSVEGV